MRDVGVDPCVRPEMAFRRPVWEAMTPTLSVESLPSDNNKGRTHVSARKFQADLQIQSAIGYYLRSSIF